MHFAAFVTMGSIQLFAASGADGRYADKAAGKPVRSNNSFADSKKALAQSKASRRFNIQQFERFLAIDVELLNQVAIADNRQAAVTTLVGGHGNTDLIPVGNGEGS